MQALKNFVEQENRWGALFGNQPLSLKCAGDRQKIADILDSKLSPENLSCDGELPRAEVQRRYRELTRVAEELQTLDPNVRFYEFG